jgi:hypothetical protein
LKGGVLGRSAWRRLCIIATLYSPEPCPSIPQKKYKIKLKKNMGEIKIGNFYKDTLGRTNLVVRRASSDSDVNKYYKSDEQNNGVFWELETISWDINCPHSGEPRMNTYWKQAEYIRENYKLLKTDKKTKIMNTIQTLIKKLSRTEPEKTFVDVGFLNENEEITDDGKEALITILWNKNKAELKELADKLNEATKTNR